LIEEVSSQWRTLVPVWEIQNIEFQDIFNLKIYKNNIFYFKSIMKLPFNHTGHP
jgi:hypothetical protein